jgi:hypothetical protein
MDEILKTYVKYNPTKNAVWLSAPACPTVYVLRTTHLIQGTVQNGPELTLSILQPVFPFIKETYKDRWSCSLLGFLRISILFLICSTVVGGTITVKRDVHFFPVMQYKNEGDRSHL